MVPQLVPQERYPVANKMLEGPQEDRLLKIGEVATKLGVTTRTVHKWAAMGRLPKVHLSRSAVRFRREDVQQMIEGSLN